MKAWTLIAASLVALSAQQGQRPAPMPVFRSSTHGVTIDVSVRAGGKPVTDLTAVDFSLLDNGVRQHIQSSAIVESVPVDVTLLIDVSGSTAGAIDDYRREVTKIAAALRPEDSIRVLTFDTYLHEVVPRQPSGTPPPVDRIQTGSFTAANDALAAALLLPAEIGRRHLIFAFTDGYDNSSLLSSDEVATAASHSDATLFVGVTSALGSSVYHVIVPSFVDPLNLPRSPLKDAAEATGGQSEASTALASDVLRTYQAYRARYVLNYDLQGTPPSGWHAVTVTINRKGRFAIQAKRGYFGTPE